MELTAIQNEREYVDFKKQQEKLRNDAIAQEKLNEKRINEMYKMQENLRNTFISVNDFIKECENKEAVAEKKVK